MAIANPGSQSFYQLVSGIGERRQDQPPDTPAGNELALSVRVASQVRALCGPGQDGRRPGADKSALYPAAGQNTLAISSRSSAA